MHFICVNPCLIWGNDSFSYGADWRRRDQVEVAALRRDGFVEAWLRRPKARGRRIPRGSHAAGLPAFSLLRLTNSSLQKTTPTAQVNHQRRRGALRTVSRISRCSLACHTCPVRTSRQVSHPPCPAPVSRHTAWGRLPGTPDICGVCPQIMVLPERWGRVGGNFSQRRTRGHC